MATSQSDADDVQAPSAREQAQDAAREKAQKDLQAGLFNYLTGQVPGGVFSYLDRVVEAARGYEFAHESEAVAYCDLLGSEALWVKSELLRLCGVTGVSERPDPPAAPAPKGVA